MKFDQHDESTRTHADSITPPAFASRHAGVTISATTLALAAGLGNALDRAWDETALSARFSRGWDDVARDTLSACREAHALHSSSTILQPE